VVVSSAVPLVEFPMPEAAVCIAPMVLEHAEGVVIVIALEAEEPDVIGLTPGVASSVAPSGRPVPPTGAAAPIPSGEVIPSGGGMAPMATCANAAPTLHNDQTVAAAKIPFAVFLHYSSSFLISPIVVAFFRGTGMKSIRPAHRTESEIATSTLLRIAFEYWQIA
jgi:hypothetical protein